jgi:hypothetical protein
MNRLVTSLIFSRRLLFCALTLKWYLAPALSSTRPLLDPLGLGCYSSFSGESFSKLCSKFCSLRNVELVWSWKIATLQKLVPQGRMFRAQRRGFFSLPVSVDVRYEALQEALCYRALLVSLLSPPVGRLSRDRECLTSFEMRRSRTIDVVVPPQRHGKGCVFWAPEKNKPKINVHSLSKTRRLSCF